MVVHDKGILGAVKIPRHRLAHDAEADEPDHKIAHNDFFYFEFEYSDRQVDNVQRKLPKS